MKILNFRLSGNDYDGAVADAMYRAAAPFGLDCLTASVDLRGLRGRSPEFTVYGDISGVAASVEIGFDTQADLMAWVATAAMIESSEPNGTEAYRAVRAVVDAIAPEPDCTHSALDNCDCYAPTSGESRE